MWKWMLVSTVAAVIQLAATYLMRGKDWGFLAVLPFILLAQFCFMTSYTRAPSFISIWFFTTAITNILSLALGLALFHEKLTLINYAGVAMILIGVTLLRV